MIQLKRLHLWIAIIAVIAVHVGVVAHRRATTPGDFDVSRELGRRFLAHEDLYAGGLHYPYLPAAALAFAPLALVGPTVGFVGRYVLALVSLALTLSLLFDLMHRTLPQLDAQRLAVTAATLALAGHYIIRDLDDSGPHCILLALIVVGLWCATRGRLAAAGACIGYATAIKAPVGLLLPFFLWSRNTRLAACSAIAAVCWILAPMLWMGSASWTRHHIEWAQTAIGSLSATPTAAIAAESEARIQNQALPAVLRRWSRRLGMDDAAGRWVAHFAALALLGTVVWMTRDVDPGSSHWLPRASAVLLAALLLSPATWTQHLVLMIPALYVVLATGTTTSSTCTPMLTAALCAYATAALFLSREILGRDRYLSLLDGGLHTLAVLIVLALVARVDAMLPRRDA